MISIFNERIMISRQFLKISCIKLAILLSFNSINGFSQSKKIGNLVFETIKEKDKPLATIRGTINVFEDNIAKKGKKIQLNIEVVAARTDEGKQAPMFIIMGGPGQAATDLVSFFSEIFEKINLKSDLVFIDQRGTGKSNPLQLKVAYNSLQDYFRDEFSINRIIKESYDSLARKNNLENYGTLNAIADIEKIRQEMAYDKINLYGTSYGTRVVIAYANKYPERVRTVTLKGLVPPGLVIPYNFAEDAQRSLDLLINDCMEDSACNYAFPELAKEMKSFFSKPFPLKIEIEDPGTNQKEQIELSKETVALNLRVLLMSPSLTKTIPYLFTQANKGNYSPLTDMILTIKKSYVHGIYDGMTLCVVCNEDYPVLAKMTLKNESQTFLKDYWVQRIRNACSLWNKEKKELPEIIIKKHNVPALIISGNRDAATPPKYGEQALKYFSNGRHLIINQGSHSFDGLRNCVENIICDFVISGQVTHLKTECIDSIEFPAYKLD